LHAEIKLIFVSNFLKVHSQEARDDDYDDDDADEIE